MFSVLALYLLIEFLEERGDGLPRCLAEDASRPPCHSREGNLVTVGHDAGREQVAAHKPELGPLRVTKSVKCRSRSLYSDSPVASLAHSQGFKSWRIHFFSYEFRFILLQRVLTHLDSVDVENYVVHTSIQSKEASEDAKHASYPCPEKKKESKEKEKKTIYGTIHVPVFTLQIDTWNTYIFKSIFGLYKPLVETAM